MRKLIPFTCVTGFVAGIVGFIWYDSLPTHEKCEADRLAEQFALNLLENAFTTLPAAQTANAGTHVQGYINSRV